MSALAPPFSTAAPSSRQRESWSILLSRFSVEEGWLTVALLALVLLSAVWSVERARWVPEMPSLSWLTLGALALGLLLAKVRVSSWITLPLAVLLGLEVVLWQSASITTGEGVRGQVAQFLARMEEWYAVANTSGISTDPLPFVLQTVFLTWFVGYFSSWVLFRFQFLWAAVIPSGIALLVNLSYLPFTLPLEFLLYLLSAMLLTMRHHLAQQQQRWRASQVPIPENVGLFFLNDSFWFALVVVLVAWLLPVTEAAPTLNQVWERAIAPWRRMEQDFDRLFASVGAGKASPLHTFGRALPFRGAVDFGGSRLFQGSPSLGQNLVFSVTSQDPGYWRGSVYDAYTREGWTTSERIERPLASELSGGSVGVSDGEEAYLLRKSVEQTITVSFPSAVLFYTGQPLAADAEKATAETAQPMKYLLQLRNLAWNAGLPQELRSLGELLAKDLRGVRRLLSDDEIQLLLPPDMTAELLERRGLSIEAITVRRQGPFPPDVSAVRLPEPLSRGQSYTVRSAISAAPGEALREAGRAYPGWVTDRYLQLPPDLPARVRALAAEWATGAANPYDQALALETQLRQYAYTLDIQAPPRGADGVDYFLFTLKKGYCDYFASAMAVMLRSLGIPSRLVTGYVSGDFDVRREVYVVRESHAHSWTEAYFPGYGWVEFNPTPAWPTLLRGEGGDFDDSGECADPVGGCPEGPIEGEEEFVQGELSEEEQLAGSNVIIRILTQWGAALRLVAVIFAVGAGVALVGRFAWLYGLSRLGVAPQLYEKLCRLGLLAGVGIRPQETPQEYQRRLSMALPSVQEEVSAIIHGYETVEFGKKTLDPATEESLQRAWRRLRGWVLMRALRWRQERRAS